MNGIELMPIMAVAGGPGMSIPAPYWLFTLLHWLTFALHLIAMNILFGGALFLLLARPQSLRDELLPAVTSFLPTVMAAAITLGVAPLLFLQVIYGRFFYSASIVSAWNWFLIIPVLIVVYYLLYLVAMNRRISPGTKFKLLILAVIGFIYVSYTFTMISDLAEKPELWQALYQSSPGGFSLNPSFMETIFRWLHIATGALAVAGLFMMLMALHRKGLQSRQAILRRGGKIFVHGVIVGVLLGLIYIFTLDSEIIGKLLRSPALHALIAALMLNIIALILVFKAVSSQRPHIKVWTSAVLVFFGIFCMVIARHILRLIYLQGDFNPGGLQVSPQWSVFVVFLVVFVAGLVTLYWMLRKYFKA